VGARVPRDGTSLLKDAARAGVPPPGGAVGSLPSLAGGRSSSLPPRSRNLGWARCHDNGAVAVTAPLGNIWLQAPEPMGKR